MTPAQSLRDFNNYPVLPLRDVVIFPSMIFPLLIGRPGTLAAVERAMLGERRLMLLAQRDPNLEDPAPSDLYSVGVVANVLQTLKLPNGLVKVLVEGLHRAEVLDFAQTENSFDVRVRPLSVTDTSVLETRAQMKVAARRFREFVSLNRQLPDEVLITLSNLNDPEHTADFMFAHLPLPIEKKQQALEQSSLLEQFRIINATLEEEIEILKIERSVEGQVREKISRSQRIYYLQEQLRVIKKELGEETDEDYSDVIAYRKKVRKAKMPKLVRARADEELDKLKGMPMMSPEASVIKNYLDWVCAMPWGTTTKDNLDLADAERILEEDHFGLKKPKERILEHLAVLARVEKIKGPILCLVGPPGVGKTSLARSIARAMGRNFVRLSLGGVRDEAEIRGHRRTYIGSMPGRIIQSMKRAASMNPVFLLDEVDKMAADFRGDPAAALLEVLDPEQNNTFSDHYLEVDFDLSQVLFITTANLRSEIPLPLQDRMEVIEIHGYLRYEKLQIARNFLIPKQVKEHGLAADELGLPDQTIFSIIDVYTRESGVRELERMIARICRKVARENIKHPGRKLQLEPDRLEKFLGVPLFKENVVEQGNRIGSAVGLAWTSMGGDVLNIQASIMKGKGNLLLTGRLGDVMKESAQAAVSFLRSRGAPWGVPENFLKDHDIHIHIPEGATPKDGPSAGITLATALLSAIIGRPVPPDIAMTGEITLRGNILPIGGLAEKVMAARRAQIKKIFVPATNRPDWADLDAELHKDISIQFVDHIEEVWQDIFASKRGKARSNRRSSRSVSPRIS
ncbi:endopeptidase La [candidate division KSB1 bacterium]|nr:MAG: endopeptidase La [candidate division KSB1 bacterium]